MKKNKVDKLFQDRLSDLQEFPDERVWESISASLDKKQSKRRVVPIWWTLGGLAAGIAILLYLMLPVGEQKNIPVITDVENKAPVKSEETQKTLPPAEKITKEVEPQLLEQQIDSEVSAAAASGNENSIGNNPDESAINTREPTFAKNRDKNKKEAIALKKEEVILAENANSTKKDQEVLVANEESDAKGAVNGENKQGVAVRNETTKTKDFANTVKREKEAMAATETEKKKSIFDEIKKDEEEAIVDVEKNANKWSVGPMVAPVYFNSLGDGSPIHSNFVSNPKSGNVNLSYGLSVSYEVSSKLSVRSGIHKVDYGYDTNEIAFSSSLTASTSEQINNIDYTSTSRTLVVESNLEPQSAQADPLASSEISAPSPARDGRMVQQFGYIEVPLELNYSLVDSKLGVNLIGGVSSLFLVDNSVTLQSANAVTEMGEANNINNVNFSTNFGLGFYYKVAPKIRLNLEPMFKYQLNTFSETSGNFQPFSVGVYSGLSFRF